MSKAKASADPFKRHRSIRYKGVSFRVLKDGSRRYAYYHAGSWVNVEGGEKDALAAQADARGKVARGEAPATPSKATFKEVAEAYLESKHRLRPGTRKTYSATLDRILIPRFGRMKLAAITVDHVAALIRAMEKDGLAATTVQAYLMPLRGVMSHAVRRRLISANPCDLLTRDDRPQSNERRKQPAWSDDDLAALIEASERLAGEPESRYDYSPLIRVAAHTGLRLGELLGLTWQDIDLHGGVLRVERQWLRSGAYGPTKTKAGVRSVPLTPATVTCLRELKLASDFSQDKHPVFASKNGTPLSHRNVTRRGFKPAVEAVALDATFHGLRHAYGSKLVAKAVPLAKVAEVMGHESAAITLSIYTHVYDAEASDAVVRAAMA